MRNRKRVLGCSFSMVLVSGLLASGVAAASEGGVGVARDSLGSPTRSAPSAVEVTTNHAKVSASSYDGQGAVGPAVIIEESDVSAFARAVDSSDDSADQGGRSGQAEATQDTTVDFVTPNVPDVNTGGIVAASWADATPNDGNDPSGEGTSEFTITFEVIGQPAGFRLFGSLSAGATPANVTCSTVTVTSPSGATFVVNSPPACGGPANLSLDEVGVLRPGPHSFSVVANAPGSNPGATGGTASAAFGLSLAVDTCTIVGTAGDDTRSGTAEADVMCGRGGNDRLEGLGGDDFIFGEGGEDVLLGGGGADTILGGADQDHIVGGSEDDHLEGEGGPDEILGGGGIDNIFGDGGSDLLLGGGDIDLIFGGPGNEVRDGGQSPGIFGGAGDDVIDGGPGDDLIEGEAGKDEIDGGPGSDKLRGQADGDTLTGGPDKDVLVGGENDDTLFARDGGRDDVLGGPGSNDQAQVDAGIDVVTDVEVLLA